MVCFRNSLTRRPEAVEASGDKLTLYTCGPTVHDYAHIGNFRAYAWEDLLRRHLEYRGFDVDHVMNITDVEDKIIRKAQEADVSIDEWTAKYTQAFFEDAETLRLLPARIYPKATEHVPEMIEIIRDLEREGHTYEADGSVYFRISSFAEYGQLAGLDPDCLRDGVRVDNDEYEKESPCDFVLWKAHKPGEPVWDSPWGQGRPGWHIECSAMSMKYLGETIDIHTGGVDNKFPHHENEIAQSQCSTGKTFVKLWMHCAHLIVDGEKMSKSLGNFYTLRQLVEMGHEPRYLRYVLIGTHYSKMLNFSFGALDQAKAELGRIDEMCARLKDETTDSDAPSAITDEVKSTREAFGACMDDDLNISGAMGEVFKLVRSVNTALDKKTVTRADASAVNALIDELDAVVGSLRPWKAAESADAEVLALVEQRQQARADKDWAASDRLRDEIAAKGFLVEDTPQGPRVKPL